jgi:hypothetical protein
MPSYTASCHCGRIRASFHSERDPSELVPRADQCGFCRRHGAMVISDPGGRLELTLLDDAPAPYRFGLGITDFHLCDRCGVFVATLWHGSDGCFGVVNLPALDERRRFRAAPISVDFEGETVAEREARRRLDWTPARILRA